MYLCATFSDELLFGKSYFFRKARFRFVYFSWIVTFLDLLLFLKDLAVHINYIFRRATFSQHTFSEETLFHSKEIITFHVYHLVIKWKFGSSFLYIQNCLNCAIDKFYLISRFTKHCRTAPFWASYFWANYLFRASTF